MELRSPITAIKGIGSRTEQRMQKIGVYTVGDILLHYPREYVQYKPPQKPSEIRQEGHHAVIGRVMSVPVLRPKREIYPERSSWSGFVCPI